MLTPFLFSLDWIMPRSRSWSAFGIDFVFWWILYQFSLLSASYYIPYFDIIIIATTAVLMALYPIHVPRFIHGCLFCKSKCCLFHFICVVYMFQLLYTVFDVVLSAEMNSFLCIAEYWLVQLKCLLYEFSCCLSLGRFLKLLSRGWHCFGDRTNAAMGCEQGIVFHFIFHFFPIPSLTIKLLVLYGFSVNHLFDLGIFSVPDSIWMHFLFL